MSKGNGKIGAALRFALIKPGREITLRVEGAKAICELWQTDQDDPDEQTLLTEVRSDAGVQGALQSMGAALWKDPVFHRERLRAGGGYLE